MDPVYEKFGLSVKFSDMTSVRNTRGYSLDLIVLELGVAVSRLVAAEKGKKCLSHEESRRWCDLMGLSDLQSDSFMMSCGLYDKALYDRSFERWSAHVNEVIASSKAMRERLEKRASEMSATMESMAARVSELEAENERLERMLSRFAVDSDSRRFDDLSLIF